MNAVSRDESFNIRMCNRYMRNIIFTYLRLSWKKNKFTPPEEGASLYYKYLFNLFENISLVKVCYHLERLGSTLADTFVLFNCLYKVCTYSFFKISKMFCWKIHSWDCNIGVAMLRNRVKEKRNKQYCKC